MRVERSEFALIPTLLGLCFVFCLTATLFFNPPLLSFWIKSLENWIYDAGIRKYYKPLSADPRIVIVDIDDSSLNEFGRWPWPRNQMADLVDKLYKLGATVVAFDILFSEPEKNIAEEVLMKIKTPIASREKIIQSFDYDAMLAKSLSQGDSILATVFSPNAADVSIGTLPSPLLTLTPEEVTSLTLPLMKHYISNIEILEKAAKNGAFINSTPDTDAVIRFNPLFLRYENSIYPSLALKAASRYLLTEKAKLQIGTYRGKKIVEGIHLDQFYIPTDPEGRILVPFRGPPYSFSYISAKDILQDRISSEAIATKLIFLGSSATAVGDLLPTAIAPVFPGVEIQASIASGILDRYLPFAPAWGKGISITLTLVLGILLAYLFARLHVFLTSLIACSLLLALVVSHQWILKKGVLFPLVPSLLTVAFLYLFNLIYGFFIEARKRKEMRSIFELYVPPSYINLMLKKGEPLSLEGDAKEITVLFSDIQDFTKISEPLTPKEVKNLINRVFTPMTQIIFNGQGTIDKYVGDMIMAFWGAPLENTRHAYDAISAAFMMLQEVGKISDLPTKEPLHFRIGINTGIMNVGDMGSQFRRAYTVVGDAVNFGSRLEQLCKFYHLHLLVGEKTREQTENDFLFRQIDRVRVAGKEVAENIYEPLCLKAKATKESFKMAEAHNQALQMYFAQDWKASAHAFSELQKSDPKYRELYQIYLDRIETFLSAPPLNNWDGAHTFTTK